MEISMDVEMNDRAILDAKVEKGDEGTQEPISMSDTRSEIRGETGEKSGEKSRRETSSSFKMAELEESLSRVEERIKRRRVETEKRRVIREREIKFIRPRAPLTRRNVRRLDDFTARRRRYLECIGRLSLRLLNDGRLVYWDVERKRPE